MGNCVILTIKPYCNQKNTMRFIGTIEAKLDSKGRVFIPAGFRRNLQQAADGSSETRLVMRKDVFEDCLVLYPETEWYSRLDELRKRLSVWNKGEQAIMRRYVTGAEWVSLDSNGRLLIPKRYLRMANMDNQVTFVGMDSTIEIWSTQQLSRHTSDDGFAKAVEDIMTPHTPT